VRKRGLPPVIDAGVDTLVLGSFPSVASLAAREYYAHPQNHFWKIIAALARLPHGALEKAAYAERTALALALGIGIWDVIAACEREGSGDERILDARLNDFAALRTLAPHLRRVCFNGQAASKLGRPALAKLGCELVDLPSTSPRNARISLAQKTAAWAAAMPGR
jgi:double-stranded uracil-DNA glycosylase